MSARNLFYAHAMVVVLGIAVDMSESYSWLNWAQALIPLAAPLMLVNLALPFEIGALASKERRSRPGIAGAVVLSAALSTAFIAGLLPVCS